MIDYKVDSFSYEIGVMASRVHPMSSCCLMDNTRFDSEACLHYMICDQELVEKDFYDGYIAEAQGEFGAEENGDNTKSHEELLGEAKQVLVSIRSKEE